MKNIVLELRFDGTAYHGWQRQANALAVQQVAEEALYGITGAKTTLTGCSRTDAGVHALRYVCNFFSDTAISTERLPFALNACLPRDIRCLKAWEAPQAFNARKNASGKRYRYIIVNSRFEDALMLNRAWHWRQPLNLAEMQAACGYFVGEHDFSAFCASGCDAADTVRRIYSLTVKKKGGQIFIDVFGNGFLRNMVRIIAGTLVYVGSGKLSACDAARIIASGDRKTAGITAPAQGLYLQDIYY